MKVLFISAWYPNRDDNMSGLFVRKHAEAVQLYADVKVLYVHPDKNIGNFEIVDQMHNDLNEVIVYYPISPGSIFHKSTKSINYIRAYKKGLKYLKEKGFSHDITHANILTRTGVMAYFLKLFRKTPYIITEHWSRYLPIRNEYHGRIRKYLTKKVVKNAFAVLPVSESLMNAMLSHNLYNPNYKVVYNVVEDIFFNIYPNNSSPQKKRILHISCFDENAKNLTGILRSIVELSKIRTDFELLLIGSGINFKETVEYCRSLHIPEHLISFEGEKSPFEVAGYLKNSNFLILFSNYETAGVVIAESLACGIPVVSTKVGIAPECIHSENGILIEPGDEKELCSKINYMLDHSQEYNSTKIKEESKQKFSYNEIGKQIYHIYSLTIK